MPAFPNLIDQVPLIGMFRTQLVLYVLLNASHVLFLGLFIGAIMPLDLGILRVPGFGWTTAVAGPLRRMGVAVFPGVASTGLLLFAVRPADYLGNGAFLLKVSVILLAGGNALLFQRISRPGVRHLLAGLSLAMWLFVLFAGRWIGFV
jgi:hypothetical protein